MYECHITLMGDCDIIKEKVHSLQLDWHFSAINGDPDMGKGVKCYLTKHYSEAHKIEDIIAEMKSLSNHLRGHGLSVVRRKIEVIIYDVRWD